MAVVTSREGQGDAGQRHKSLLLLGMGPTQEVKWVSVELRAAALTIGKEELPPSSVTSGGALL